MEGKKSWFLVDGYRPSPQPDPAGHYEGHESIMILNTHKQDAHVSICLYFEDKEPVENIAMLIPARRIRTFRSSDSHLLGGCVLNVNEQYSMVIKSDLTIIVQYGRLDVQQANMAYMALMGYGE